MFEKALQNSSQLNHRVSKFADLALASRQIARRLKTLLPMRLRDLRTEHASGVSAAKAERLALMDPRYTKHVDELISMSAEATLARIQYETHLMLVEARRSLR